MIFCIFDILDLATNSVLGSTAAAFGLPLADPGPDVLGEASVTFEDGSVARTATKVALGIISKNEGGDVFICT